MNKYQPFDIVYFIVSNLYVKKATVIRFSSGMYVLQFPEGGGMRICENRLYSSPEAAAAALRPVKKKTILRGQGDTPSHYDGNLTAY